MRDGLAAGDRVQLHINNGRNKAYIRNGLDWIKRFPVGRSAAFCPGRVKSASGTFETSRRTVTMSVRRGRSEAIGTRPNLRECHETDITRKKSGAAPPWATWFARKTSE
jgi:hypothetical protein